MGQGRTRLYDGVINDVVVHFRTQKSIDKEDLKQELWLKVLLVMPTLEATSEDEVRALAFVILKNHLSDLLGKNKTRQNVNCLVNTGEIDFNDFADSMMQRAGNRFLTPHDDYSHKELYRILNKWWETQNPRIKLFTKELFGPSAETLEKWENLKMKCPMYKQFDSIPPNTLGKFFNIPPITVLKKMKELRTHFRQHGYKGA